MPTKLSSFHSDFVSMLASFSQFSSRQRDAAFSISGVPSFMAYTSKWKTDLSFLASKRKVWRMTLSGPSSLHLLPTHELITLAKGTRVHDTRWVQSQMSVSVFGGVKNDNCKPHWNYKAWGRNYFPKVRKYYQKEGQNASKLKQQMSSTNGIYGEGSLN